jgi:putative endonuclease
MNPDWVRRDDDPGGSFWIKGTIMRLGGWVYIMASKPMGTLYIGSTSDLESRTWQHKNEFYESFTKKYGVKMLVYYESHESLERMVQRERQMKEWKRDWKLARIIEMNPSWKDLFDEFANRVIDITKHYEESPEFKRNGYRFAQE